MQSYFSLFLLCVVVACAQGQEYHLLVTRQPSRPDGYPRSTFAIYEKNRYDCLTEARHGRNGRDCPSVWPDMDRPFPGPMLRGTEGAMMNVTVTNLLLQETISIHFHGITMTQNPWMDGVVGLTECGIGPGQTFSYVFHLEHGGTFWYHSHVAVQYSDGLLGPLVIESKDAAPDLAQASFNYTTEWTLMIQDWMHETASDVATMLVGPRDSFPGFLPQYPSPPSSLLINGLGQFQCEYSNIVRGDDDADDHVYDDYADDNARDFMATASGTPRTLQSFDTFALIDRPPLLGKCLTNLSNVDTYDCHYQSSVRIRIVNSGSAFPLRLEIGSHYLWLTAKDGIDLPAPIRTTFVDVQIGQRYDVVVSCLQDPNRLYNISVTLTPSDNAGHTHHDHSRFVKKSNIRQILYARAFLRYQIIPGVVSPPPPVMSDTSGAPPAPPPRLLHQVGPSRATTPSIPTDYTRAYTALSSDVPYEYGLSQYRIPSANDETLPADERIFIVYRSYSASSPSLETWLVNNHSFSLHGATSSPILQQYMGAHVSLNQLFNHTSTLRVQYNKSYEFVMIGMDSFSHPWHFHGYTVNITQMGPLSQPMLDCFAMHPDGSSDCGLNAVLSPLNRSAPTSSRGDTFLVPSNAYVAFRFRASNQGPWMFHCHNNWHMLLGMGLVVSVENGRTGLEETLYSDLKSPPADFTTCGAQATWSNSRSFYRAEDIKNYIKALDEQGCVAISATFYGIHCDHGFLTPVLIVVFVVGALILTGFYLFACYKLRDPNSACYDRSQAPLVFTETDTDFE